MKKIILGVVLMATGPVLYAQSETARPGEKATTTYKSPVAKEGIPVGFESNLATGHLTLVKQMTKNSSGAFITTYSLKLKNSSFNQGSPYSVTLTRASFDTYFQRSSPEVYGKWQEMLNYVQGNKLTLDDETSWKKAVNYFNTL
jgi:hypothetical protein